MARRTLQASESGIQAIKAALKQQKRSQEYLAGAVGCSRQTIWSLLQGNAVDCETLMAACKELGLDWQEVTAVVPEPQSYQLDELVREVRGQAKRYIDEYCSTMRVLNMTQKIELSEIYTSVNILQKLTRSRQLRFDELLELSRDKFELLARGEFVKRGVPGLEAVQAHDKLMVFGKPGAGKTTFLKFVALQCSAGRLFPKLIPLFVPLKEWAEAEGSPGLLQHLINLFASYGIAPNAQVKQGLLSFLTNRNREAAQERVNLTAVEEVLREGRILLLLDGLDEVRQADTRRVIREIEEFARQFPKNRYVVTCRIAAKDYVFEQFTEVEVADFNDEQVETFIENWFKIKQLTQVAERLTERLRDNQPMRELACSPILLTLLCLVFEESGELSPNRAELYKRGLDLLLSRWDATRGIERDQVYRRLSLRAKEEMLSEIAYGYFERGEYFFKQESVTEEIADCLYNLPGASEEAADLRVTAEAVLKSIESQHGLLVERADSIYSFSHLTFQEYLTARWIRESRQDSMLVQLVKHLYDSQWREVFILTAGMLNREGANCLIQTIQKSMEMLVEKDDKIQDFLVWLKKKTEVAETTHKQVVTRVFYIYMGAYSALARTRTFIEYLTFSRALDFYLTRALELARALDLSLVRRPPDLDLDLVHALDLDPDLDLVRALACGVDLALNLDLDLNVDFYLDRARSNYSLQCKLEALKVELPEILQVHQNKRSVQDFFDWWKANGEDWSDRLRQVIVEHRNIGHDWQFGEEQTKVLNQYLEANKLLADCLNADCYISRQVRHDIEATMLMPQSFIDEYRQQRKQS